MCVCWRLNEKVQTLLMLGGLVNRQTRDITFLHFWLRLSFCEHVQIVVISFMQDATFELVTTSWCTFYVACLFKVCIHRNGCNCDRSLKYVQKSSDTSYLS